MKTNSKTKRMVALLLALLTMAALLTALPFTASAETSGIYTYTVSGGEATITDCDTSASGAIEIPSTLDGYPVTSIGNDAFEYCDDLTSITIPDSLKSIGYATFGGCSSLASITIPDSVTSIGDSAFADCTSLASIEIPAGVTSIGDGTFEDCASLESITILAGVTSIGDRAFSCCASLTSIKIPDGVISIGVHAFSYCDSLTSITIPDGVISIGADAFEACESLASITIPAGVTSIGDSAFSWCDSLESITIPAGVTSIGDDTFFSCDSLASITIPDGVISIGADAFAYCSSLASITIPDSVTSIGDSAFEACESLASITIPAGVTSIGDSAFEGCSSLASITIPDSVTSIGYTAFEGCGSLTSITIPDGVTSIGERAFRDCNSLTSITIPDSVTSIGAFAFSWCDSLESITIPDSVTSIGSCAFSYCDSLTDVYYTGSQTEWEAIKIYGGYSELLEATIHFNCVDKSGSSVSGETNSTKSLALDKLRLVIYENKNDSSKDSDSYRLSKNATVTSGTETVVSDEKGSVLLQYSGKDITIAKDGYVTQTIPAAQAEKAKNIYLQKDTGNKPIINAVWIDNTDVCTDEYYIDLLSTESITLSTEVTWKSGAQSKIYLMQDARRVEFIGNTLTTVLSDNFDVSKTIYIVAEDTEGNATKKKLKFKADGGISDLLNNYKLSFGDSVTGTIPESVPVIGGGKVGLDIPMIPLTVTFENNKFYAVLGLDVAKASEEYGFTENVNGTWHGKYNKSTKYLFENIKDGFKNSADSYSPSKLMEKWKKARYNYSGKVGFEADVTVIGYLEGYVNSDGNVSILDGGVGIKPSFEVSVGSQFWVMPPLYWEASLKGEIEAMLSVYLNETAKNFSPNGSVGGDITLKGGVGLGASGVVGISGGVEGKIGVDWDIYKDKQDYVAVSGSIGAYVKAFVGPFTILDESFPFAEGIIWDYPSTRVNALSVAEQVNLYSLQSYKLIDRGYADSLSAFVANEQPVNLAAFTPQSRVEQTLKTNVYTYSEPQLAAFPDGTQLAVWVDDDTARTDINRTALTFSYYNGSTWSSPAQIQNDGTADFSPNLEIIDGTAYIAWVNTKNILSNSADNSAVFTAWEISAAVFNKETASFEAAAAVTDNAAIDMMPQIFGGDGEVHLAWVENTSGDLFGTGTTYSVKTSTLEGGVWTAPDVNASGLGPVDSLDAYLYDGTPYIAYSMDLDGNQTDYTDKEIFLNNLQLTDNEVLDAKPVFANGKLYYYSGGCISEYNLADSATEAIAEGVSSDRFQVVSDGENMAILYGETDALVTELCAVMQDSQSGKWGSPQVLTALGANISSFSGTFAEDGKLQFVINKTKITGEIDSENPYGQTDLVLLTVTPGYNLSLDDAVYHGDLLLAGNTLEFYTTITNDGELAVKDYKVEVIDGSGNVLATTYNEEAILPGQTVDFTAYYPLGDSKFSPHTVTLKLTAINAAEQDEGDNTLSMPLTYENIALENLDYGIDESGKAVVYADIVNRGYSAPGSITASLRRGSADGEVVDTVTVTETLDTLELAAIDFTVPMEHGTVYYVTLDKEGENSDFVVLQAENNYLYYNSTTGEIVVNSETAHTNARLIVAAYKGEELIAMKLNPVSISEGETRIANPMTDFGNADTVRIMLWSSTGIAPLMGALEFTP